MSIVVGSALSRSLWPWILSSVSLPLGITEPSSLFPIHVYIIVLRLATSQSNSVFTISNLICHPPLMPWSILSWSCSDSDINHLQHSILFVRPFLMLPHDNPLLQPISLPDPSWIHGFHMMRRLSLAGSELGWPHLSPHFMSHQTIFQCFERVWIKII